MKTEVCSKCSSPDVVSNARVREHDAISHQTLSVNVLKGSPSSEIRAWMCGNCGFTEFFALQPSEFSSAYRQNRL